MSPASSSHPPPPPPSAATARVTVTVVPPPPPPRRNSSSSTQPQQQQQQQPQQYPLNPRRTRTTSSMEHQRSQQQQPPQPRIQASDLDDGEAAASENVVTLERQYHKQQQFVQQQQLLEQQSQSLPPPMTNISYPTMTPTSTTATTSTKVPSPTNLPAASSLKPRQKFQSLARRVMKVRQLQQIASSSPTNMTATSFAESSTATANVVPTVNTTPMTTTTQPPAAAAPSSSSAPARRPSSHNNNTTTTTMKPMMGLSPVAAQAVILAQQQQQQQQSVQQQVHPNHHKPVPIMTGSSNLSGKPIRRHRKNAPSVAHEMLQYIQDIDYHPVLSNTNTTNNNNKNDNHNNNNKKNNDTDDDDDQDDYGVIVDEALHGTQPNEANRLYEAADLAPTTNNNNNDEDTSTVVSEVSQGESSTYTGTGTEDAAPGGSGVVVRAMNNALQLVSDAVQDHFQTHTTKETNQRPANNNTTTKNETEPNRRPGTTTTTTTTAEEHMPLLTHLQNPFSSSNYDGDEKKTADGNEVQTTRLPAVTMTTTTTPSQAPQQQQPPLATKQPHATAKPAGYGTVAAGVRQSRKHRRRFQKKQQQKLLRFVRRLWREYISNASFWKNLLYQKVLLHSCLISVALPCFVLQWILFYSLGNPTFDFLPGVGRLSWWCNFVGRQIVTLELSRLTQFLLLDAFVLGTRMSVQWLGPLVTLIAIQAKGWPFLLTTWGMWDMLLLHGDQPYVLHWLYWTGFGIYSSKTTTTGLAILANDTYLRVLWAMVLAGLATTAKRAALAVYFGRRQLVEFKPRLEKLLGDIVLLSDVATLGEEAELVAQQEADEEHERQQQQDDGEANHTNHIMKQNNNNLGSVRSRSLSGSLHGTVSGGGGGGNNHSNNNHHHQQQDKEYKIHSMTSGRGLSAMVYNNVQFSTAVHASGTFPSSGGRSSPLSPLLPSSSSATIPTTTNNHRSGSLGMLDPLEDTVDMVHVVPSPTMTHHVQVQSQQQSEPPLPPDLDDGYPHTSNTFFPTDDDDALLPPAPPVAPAQLVPNRRDNLSRTTSGTFHIKSFLDRWEEPEIKSDKGNLSIEDVLRFRRALACMDEEHPFGEAFGPADSRDACIQSANSLYYNLMKLDPTADQLAFDVLALAIATDDEQQQQVVEESEEYEMKKKAFRRLFRPDVHGDLPLLAFVQSCDTVYRRLRYFIASVRNSSVIDKALENTFNSIFFFVLAMILMSVMRFNPWPMLVSITSLLVSISFALGPSVSKYVQGVLLIAARRPYDLGDRIFITDSNSVENPGANESWFVEDINLWCTTLRFARTNEVSTINNAAIASSRIVNCNRSPHATVEVEFNANLSLLKGTKLADFRAAVERYVKDHPRTWEAIAYIRHDEYNADIGKITMRLAVRHRNCWQDAARILINRGQLLRFLHELGDEMGIHFSSPLQGQLVYEAGRWQPPSIMMDGSKQSNKNFVGKDSLAPGNSNSFDT